MSERKSEHSTARKQAKMAISRWDNEGGAAARNLRQDATVRPKQTAFARPRKTSAH